MWERKPTVALSLSSHSISTLVVLVLVSSIPLSTGGKTSMII